MVKLTTVLTGQSKIAELPFGGYLLIRAPDAVMTYSYECSHCGNTHHADINLSDLAQNSRNTHCTSLRENQRTSKWSTN
ncbi:Uncharacterised protein [Escherichia coli]|uniref:Uncharacterized protein n=1 Tax=Escherichia coli TaxID=562 RepID=A0A2X1LF29_ECOLX|nr:Uncharacterised protein [Escherichia coli]